MRIHSMIAAGAATAASTSAAHTAAAKTVTVPSWANYVASLPPYRPSRQVSGTVTSWGHGFLKTMMRDWEQDFHRFQPNVRFQDDLASSAAARSSASRRDSTGHRASCICLVSIGWWSPTAAAPVSV